MPLQFPMHLNLTLFTHSLPGEFYDFLSTDKAKEQDKLGGKSWNLAPQCEKILISGNYCRTM